MENQQLTILNVINDHDINKVTELTEQFNQFIESLVINVTEENLEEYKANATALNKFATEFNKRAIAWEKEKSAGIKDYRSKLNEFSKLAKSKREEITKELEVFEKAEAEKRLELAYNYYLEQIRQVEVFEFVSFNSLDHSNFTKKGAVTAKGALTKKSKEIIDSFIEKYANDYAIIKDNGAVITEYVRNGHKLAEAINYVDELTRYQEEQRRLREAENEAREAKLNERIENKVEKVEKEEVAKVVVEKNTTTVEVEIPNKALEQMINLFTKYNFSYKTK